MPADNGEGGGGGGIEAPCAVHPACTLAEAEAALLGERVDCHKSAVDALVDDARPERTRAAREGGSKHSECQTVTRATVNSSSSGSSVAALQTPLMSLCQLRE